MLDGESSSNEDAGRAFRICLALVVAQLLVVPFASIQLPQLPGIAAVYGAIQCLLDAAVFLLIWRSPRLSPAGALLAASFLYSAVMAVLHVLLFPGAVAASGPLLPVLADAAGWFYLAWKMGFALMLIAAITLSGRPVREGVPKWPVLLASAPPVLMLLALEIVSLPAYITDAQQFARATLAGVYLACFACVLGGALIWLSGLTGRRFYLWLGVLCAADAISLSLSTIAGGRYTVGWYLARLVHVGGTMIFLYHVGRPRALRRPL